MKLCIQICTQPSRGGPTKYCSSNRIATIMGNGIMPLIDEKVKYQDFLIMMK